MKRYDFYLPIIAMTVIVFANSEEEAIKYGNLQVQYHLQKSVL